MAKRPKGATTEPEGAGMNPKSYSSNDVTQKSGNDVSTDSSQYRSSNYFSEAELIRRNQALGDSWEGALGNAISTSIARANLDHSYAFHETGVKRVKGWWAIARKLLGTLNEYVRVPLQNVLIQQGLGSEVSVAIPNNLYEEVAAFLLDASALLPSATELLYDQEANARLDDLYDTYEAYLDAHPRAGALSGVNGGKVSRDAFKSSVLTNIDDARKRKITRSIEPDTLLHYFSTVVIPTALTVPSEAELMSLISLCRETHTMMLSNVNPTIVHSSLRDNEFVLAGATINRSLTNPYTVSMRTLDAINMYMGANQYVKNDATGAPNIVSKSDDRLVYLNWEGNTEETMGSWHICDLVSPLENLPDLDLRDIYRCYIYCISVFSGETLQVTSVETLRRYHTIGLSYVPALAMIERGAGDMSDDEIGSLVRRIITFFYVRNILGRNKGPIANELDAKYQQNLFRAREAVDLEGVTHFLSSLGGWFDALGDASAFFNELLRTRDIFTQTPALREKLIEKLDKFIVANMSEPEKTGVMRSSSGPGYLSDINRLLERMTPGFKAFSYSLEPYADDVDKPQLPIPLSANGQGYISYSLVNRVKSPNFHHTTMNWLFSTSNYVGKFNSETLLVTTLPSLGGTSFDNYFTFLSASDMKSKYFVFLHKRASYKQITRLQDVASIGGLDVYIQPSMLKSIGMISHGDYNNNTWVASVPTVDPNLLILRCKRKFVLEEFKIPSTDKFVAFSDWPSLGVKIEQTHIEVEQEHLKFLNEAVVAHDSRMKWNINSSSVAVPTNKINNPDMSAEDERSGELDNKANSSDVTDTATM